MFVVHDLSCPQVANFTGALVGTSLAIHLTQQCCIFQPVRQSTARGYTKAVIPVSPQGKTGISRTQARGRKDEIPALRFARPE